MRTPGSLAAKTATAAPSDAVRLRTGLRKLIEQARHTAAAVNAGLTFFYWDIGQRLRAKVLGGQGAGYGEEIVVPVLRQLFSDYGRCFSAKSPRYMLRFAEVFPSRAIVSTLSRQSQARVRNANPELNKE
jgi:hypothetical protein